MANQAYLDYLEKPEYLQDIIERLTLRSTL